MGKTIITYPGTGYREAQEALKALGLKLVSCTSLDDYKKIRSYDGVMILGGRDINPFWYGEENRYSQEADKTRDAVEWLLIRQGITKGVPIMGICRGCQFIAAAHGGSLYQDVNKQGATRHPHGYGAHNIDTRLRQFENHIPDNHVNSYHHQAIRVVPAGFTVAATAPDGVVEAIWKPGTLGVQFHPETLFATNHRWIGLFKWFAEGLR